MKIFDAGALGAQRRRTGTRGALQGNRARPDQRHRDASKAKPYAIANDRSTRGREPAGELAFSELDSDQVHSPAGVLRSRQQTRDDVQHGLPRQQKHRLLLDRAPAGPRAGHRPEPADARAPGEYDWQGFLSLEQHPHEVDPASDVLLNWNNKPAPEWGAASDNYSYGPVQRVQLYTGFNEGMTEADDVSIMNKAATQDLRGGEGLAGDRAGARRAAGAEHAGRRSGEPDRRSGSKKGASRSARNEPKEPGAAVDGRGLDADRRSGARARCSAN